MATILFRPDLNTEEEFKIAQKYFATHTSRMDLPNSGLVIGRYSVLPFYNELHYDLSKKNSVLINSPAQHAYLADIQLWYKDLAPFTPFTWFSLQDLPDNGPFVVKGQTNSRKFQWDTHMFAQDKRTAVNIAVELQNDSILQYQNIYARKYVPLHTYGTAIHGLPITHEFRFFIAYGHILSGGYYWSNHVNDLPITPNPKDVPQAFLQKVIDTIGPKANFYALDVALTQDEQWIVIELNDGQMAGLSENNPHNLYSNLLRIVNPRKLTFP